MKNPTRYSLGLIVVALVVLGLMISCSETDRNPIAPNEQILLNESHPMIRHAMDIQILHTRKIMEDPEVVGTATGLTDDGEPAVLVLLKSAAGGKRIGKTIDGVTVVKIVTGPIKAYGKPSTGPDHKARQTRPIELGVSGGNINDIANGYCCGGTIGALVTDASTQYILSNSHVLCNDIAASAGDPDVAEIGDLIVQPALIDVYCYQYEDDAVGTLSTLTSLVPATNVDAAVAEVITGTVKTDGSILEVGTISSSTVAAYVGQDVKKSGRTTGLTRSEVTGLNATVNVGYEDECNGVPFTVLYTGQILVKNRASKFLNSGDSGSLMVEDVDTNPRAIGLLYAGGGQIAVANPIDDVLNYLGDELGGTFTMVGQ
jgi:hypothetical protein